MGQLAAHWPDAKWSISPDSGSEPHEANLLQLNCDKAKEYLGWSSSWSIEQSVRATAEWYQRFYSGGDVRELTIGQIRQYQSAF